MTTPTLASLTGISIIISDPLVASPRGSYGDFADRVTDYSHTIGAAGGFLSCSFTIAGSLNEIEAFYADGIGRHVQVYNAALVLVWEGFVNSITINLGAMSNTIGPLTDIANQVVVVYTPIDPTADPPATGPETETTAGTDATSQAKYGTWEKVYSGGSLYDGAATPLSEQIRDTLLGDLKDPATTQGVAVDAQEGPSVTVECRGYYDWFMAYIFNDTATGTSTITAKIEDIIDADPNGIFNTVYDQIATNAALVAARERDNGTALELLETLTASGDGTNFYRYALQVYGDRKVYYSAVPSSVHYLHALSDPAERIELPDGALVEPWDVRPWRWLFVTDYLIGRTQPTADLRTDPRNILIETVTYTAPYGIEINGARLQDLPQLIGQLGLTGLY